MSTIKHHQLSLKKEKTTRDANRREKQTARLKAKFIHKRMPGVSQYEFVEIVHNI